MQFQKQTSRDGFSAFQKKVLFINENRASTFRKTMAFILYIKTCVLENMCLAFNSFC